MEMYIEYVQLLQLLCAGRAITSRNVLEGLRDRDPRIGASQGGTPKTAQGWLLIKPGAAPCSQHTHSCLLTRDVCINTQPRPSSCPGHTMVKRTSAHRIILFAPYLNAYRIPLRI